MSRTRTFYEVLGVAPDATVEEIRRAYRAKVRRWHPDHLGERSADPKARADAERRIRTYNQAWQALRDPERRARYDRTLPVATPQTLWSPYPPGTEAEPDGGFEEWFADADRRHHEARVVTRRTVSARPFRARFLIGCGLVMLAGILLIVLITGKSPGTAPPGVGQGMCVRIDPGPQTVEVPCTDPNDGKVLSQVMVPGECPNGATARRLDPGDAGLTCLAPAGH